MYRTFPAQKDAYITDRIIQSRRATGGNTGRAGTMDIFKLYGVSQSGSVQLNELSRALIQFDISEISSHMSASGRSWSDASFKAHLKLFDVYSGHPTPANFSLVIIPVSQSWDEGTGRDVATFKDLTACNFLTASYSGSPIGWHVSGANGKGLLGSADIDVITSGNLGAGIATLMMSQSFTVGDENLYVDVTTLVSAALAGLIPNYGYRISFIESEENDGRTRFVKRFASRHASDKSKHPKLVVRWDDSLQNDRNNLTFDASGTIRLFNHYVGGLRNIVSGAALSQLTGLNCMKVRLETPVSGGLFSATFDASQVQAGTSWLDGTYAATIALPSSNSQLMPQIHKSGSVTFKEIWTSVDNTLGFHTGTFVMYPQDTQAFGLLPVQHRVNVVNCSDLYRDDESPIMRVFVQKVSPNLPAKKIPVVATSHIPSEAHFSVRDAISNEVIIPFDETYNSTRMSTDSSGLTFRLYMDTLVVGRTYAIDVMIKEGPARTTYRDASRRFTIEESA